VAISPVLPLEATRHAPAYQLSAILDSPWLSYSNSTTFIVGTVLHTGYDWK